ncbi:hypothetical protein [Sphingomonas melonis]|uniref:hypothetical protein n=1 Tax=Sphingomonas melonis TaxID=152682 RepID=UPI0036DB8A26
MTETCTIPPAGWACTRAAGHDGPCAAITTGEADYREYRAWAATSPDHQPEGTLEALEICASMLERFGPDCLPANEHGQADFARIMMDATAAEIRAFLAARQQEQSHEA